MFGMLKSAVKAVTVVVDAPVSLAADAGTLGGVLNERDESYTESAAKRFVQNVADVADPDAD